MIKERKRKLFDQSQEVIRRWLAINTIRLIRPYVESAGRYYLRLKLKSQEKKHSLVLIDALNATIKNFKKTKNSKSFEPLGIFFNLSLFFLLAEKDIQSVKIDALSHSDEWKRNLCLRIILLTIHEWDMAKVAPANKLKEAYNAAGISDDLIKEMNAAFRKINKAHAKAKSLLSSTRHSTIAHRDADALFQYETIMKVNPATIMEIANSFYEGTDLFVKALPKLMLEAGSTHSLLKQYRDSNHSAAVMSPHRDREQ